MIEVLDSLLPGTNPNRGWNSRRSGDRKQPGLGRFIVSMGGDGSYTVNIVWTVSIPGMWKLTRPGRRWTTFHGQRS